jgi:gamma-butyrobetaine dioxygenase
MTQADQSGRGQTVAAEAASQDAEWLTVAWAHGGTSVFPAMWLRDNIPEGRQGAAGQRLFDIAAVPRHIELQDAYLDEDGRIVVQFAPEDMTARFDPAWLYAHDLSAEARARRRPAAVTWGRDLADVMPEARYEDVTGNQAVLARWLAFVRDHGFALLRGVPAEPGRILDVVSLFGHVRETNYGRLFDVVSTDAPSNLAYTGLALGLHTDNPYRDPVPGLQLLHCLEASAEGGDSLVCDGFRAAEALRQAAPEDFALLTRYPVAFRYTDEAVDLRSEAPLIEVDWQGRVTAVRYNNRSAAPIDLPPEVVPDFYRAYRRFGRMLHDAEGLVSFRMAPGDLFIVDNRRVLHGRSGFGGKRHLQGCYADRDALLSRLRILEGCR